MFKNNPNLTKKEKIEKLQKKHEPVFSRLGVNAPVFLPKLIFGTPKVMYLFPSELKHGRDIYTEKVNKDYKSEDPTRTLYKWKFNPNYETEYPQKQFGQSSDHMSVIPFDELVAIPAIDPAEEFNIPNPDEDAPFSELTIRDLTAIITGKPVSQKAWLNKIIKS